jgi:AAA+ ATPase superfamily predicted ATPase
MDEFPYLVEQDPSLETTLQKVWDRYLGEAPVLLVLIGSDISMMSALTEYDRPLYGRPTLEIVVEPFGPHETAEMLGFSAADAIDAQLVLGGFPRSPGTGMSGSSDISRSGGALGRTRTCDLLMRRQLVWAHLVPAESPRSL